MERGHDVVLLQLGERVRLLRRQVGLSQEELAHLSGMGDMIFPRLSAGLAAILFDCALECGEGPESSSGSFVRGQLNAYPLRFNVSYGGAASTSASGRIREFTMLPISRRWQNDHETVVTEDSMKRTLILVRHAKSSWEGIGLPDTERPLADRGKRDAPMMGSAWRSSRRNPTYSVESRTSSACDGANHRQGTRL